MKTLNRIWLYIAGQALTVYHFFKFIIEDFAAEFVAGLLVLFGLFMLVLLFVAIEKDKAAWEEYAAKHNCFVVEKMKGGVSLGTQIRADGSVGTVVIPESDKTAWKCDDGVTYWR